MTANTAKTKLHLELTEIKIVHRIVESLEKRKEQEYQTYL